MGGIGADALDPDVFRRGQVPGGAAVLAAAHADRAVGVDQAGYRGGDGKPLCVAADIPPRLPGPALVAAVGERALFDGVEATRGPRVRGKGIRVAEVADGVRAGVADPPEA